MPLIIALLALPLLGLAALAARVALNRDTPLLFAPFVYRYRREDRRAGQQTCANVFTGSSVMRFWHTLEEDLAPSPALNRAIPGTKIHEIAAYADALVNAHRPERVFLYAGSNDIQGDHPHTAEHVLAGFQQFVARVWRRNPAARIYYISILIAPAPARLRHRATIERANQLIRAHCDAHDGLTFVDLAPDFLDAGGMPDPALFVEDGIHLQDSAYALWKRRILPHLQPAEGQG